MVLTLGFENISFESEFYYSGNIKGKNYYGYEKSIRL